MYLEHAKDDGKDVRVGTRLWSWLASCPQIPVADQVRLHESIPKEAVVGPLPEWRGAVVLGLPLEAVGEIDRVGEVHGPRLDEGLEDQKEFILVWIADLSFAHGEDVGGDDLVDHVALKPTHGLSFGDDDDILVCRVSIKPVTNDQRR